MKFVMGCNLFFQICNGCKPLLSTIVTVVTVVMGHLYTPTHRKTKNRAEKIKMERLPITTVTFKHSKGFNPLHDRLHTHYNPLQICQLFPKLWEHINYI
jgi:hypothetical protein